MATTPDLIIRVKVDTSELVEGIRQAWLSSGFIAEHCDPLIAEARREGWDEGFQAALFPGPRTNPYRAAAVSGGPL